MHIASLAYRTHLIFPRFDGTIADRGGYLAVHTPANRGYYWGNFLLFSQPPRPGDEDRWPRLFEREFGHDAAVGHQAFGWDAPEGERGAIAAFLDRGYLLDDEVVLTADAVRAHPRAADVTVRPLAGDDDWRAMVELNLASDPRDDGDGTYGEFKHALRTRYRAMVEGGLGTWLGAFAGDTLVGQLGLFPDGELARFQSVETHPEHRGRGVCSTLFAAACRFGLYELGARRLVIAAEQDSTAHRIYLAAGFTERERQLGIYRPPLNER